MKKIFSFCILLILFITSCKDYCRWSLPPNIFYFIIMKDGHPLPDSILDNTVMYFINSRGEMVTNPDSLQEGPNAPDLDDTVLMFPATRTSPGLANTGVMSSGYVYETRTWYLKYPDGDIDTFYVETTHIPCKKGAKNRCYCDDPYTKVEFNGHTAPEYTELNNGDGKPIFLFEK